MLVELTVQGDLDSLEVIRRFVAEQAESAGFEKKIAYKLVLAIDEIASNTISYGYKEHGLSGDILLTAELTDSELIIVLEDTAAPYDPRATDIGVEEEIKKPLEDRNIGGLGVFLMLNGVDRFEYEYVNNRNRNIFAMRRGEKGTAS